MKAAPPAPATPAPATIDVRALLGGAREIVLMLDGEAYRLRLTSRGKLILTK